jgi:hypothetical protein
VKIAILGEEVECSLYVLNGANEIEARTVVDEPTPETASAKFERQIERIHHLIEAEGVEVTWNDKIPDPDNPKQPRQIDVTICRDGRLTLVECRIHRNRQGVKVDRGIEGPERQPERR